MKGLLRSRLVLGLLLVGAAFCLGLYVRNQRRAPVSSGGDKALLANSAPAPSVHQRRRLPNGWDEIPEGGIPERREHQVESRPTVKGVGAASRPVYFPRDEHEWQGRLVEVAKEPCADDGHCGRARACLSDGRCGPCQRDSDCPASESCVLDQCIRAGRVLCRRRADCPNQSYCVLWSDGTNAARGNEGLTAVCLGSEKHIELREARGRAREVIDPDLPPNRARPPEPIDQNALVEDLRKASAQVGIGD